MGVVAFLIQVVNLVPWCRHSAPAYCTKLCQLGDCHLSDFPPVVAEDMPTTGSPLSTQTHRACSKSVS
ncbi:hypothetical protein AOLI_G00112840 [Acnodon oligacanthus]